MYSKRKSCRNNVEGWNNLVPVCEGLVFFRVWVLILFYQGNHSKWMSWLKTLILFPPVQHRDNYSYLHLQGPMSLNYLIFAKCLEIFELKVLSYETNCQCNYNWNEFVVSPYLHLSSSCSFCQPRHGYYSALHPSLHPRFFLWSTLANR